MSRSSEFSGKTIFHLLGFFSFLILPFSFAPGALDPSYHLRLIIWSFLSLGLVLWVSKGHETQRCDPSASLTRQKIFWVGGGFLLISAFSLLRCVNMAEGIFVWLTFLLAGAFFLISSLILVQYPNGMLILSQWALGAATGLVILGLAGRYWQTVQPNPFFLKGIMVNKNLYSSSLFLLLPFLFHCLAAGRKLWSGTVAAILLPALSITALISLSRAVWLAIIFATVPVFMLIFCASLGSRKKEQSVIPFVKKGTLFFLFLLALLWACPFLSRSVKIGETAQLRLNLWERTVQMIQNELFCGVGPGQWRLVLPIYGQPMKINGSGRNMEILAQRPHNDLLSITAETGIWGGICYFLFFGILYYYAFKVVTRANPGEKNLVLAMVYGISGYLIISFFSYLRERPFHTLLMLLMAAAIVSSYHRLYPTKSIGIGCWMIPLKSAMVILLMVCCLGSGLRLYSEIQLKKALQARARGEWYQVIASIDKAFLSVYSIDPFGVPLPWYRGMAHYNNNNLPMALKDFHLALVYHPYHDHSLNNVAVVEKMIQKP